MKVLWDSYECDLFPLFLCQCPISYCILSYSRKLQQWKTCMWCTILWEKIHLPACSRRDAYSRRQTVTSSCSLQLSSTLPFIVVPFCDSGSTESSVQSLGVIEICLPFYCCAGVAPKVPSSCPGQLQVFSLLPCKLIILILQNKQIFFSSCDEKYVHICYVTL